MVRRVIFIAVCALHLTACLQGERILGNVPEGTVPAGTAVGAETYLRRAFADLHGIVPAPGDPQWVRALALVQGGLAPAARDAVAEALLAERPYALAFYDEHVTPLFSALGGVDGATRFLLYYIDEILGMTSNPQERQFLQSFRSALAAERDELATLPDRLHAREIDEAEVVARAARSTAALVLSGPEAYARALFREILGREPGLHERRQAAAMARAAAFVPGNAPVAGVVLRREGRTIDDLVQILVGSDAFLEARVRALFRRLLGRDPEPGEVWALFADLRDARRRGDFGGGYRRLLRTLVTSDEYVRP
jgi:hypothetical protein